MPAPSLSLSPAALDALTSAVRALGDVLELGLPPEIADSCSDASYRLTEALTHLGARPAEIDPSQGRLMLDDSHADSSAVLHWPHDQTVAPAPAGRPAMTDASPEHAHDLGDGLHRSERVGGAVGHRYSLTFITSAEPDQWRVHGVALSRPIETTDIDDLAEALAAHLDVEEVAIFDVAPERSTTTDTRPGSALAGPAGVDLRTVRRTRDAAFGAAEVDPGSTADPASMPPPAAPQLPFRPHR
jgi:hypothetical protein